MNFTDVQNIDDQAALKFLADFQTMSMHGATEAGGVHREAGSVADAANRHWFKGLVEGYGAKAHYDAIGNLYGLWEITPGAPYVLVGSHLDSQPFGGRFDGAYGVLCGAHACANFVHSAQKMGEKPKFNVAVVDWFNEEGSRFKPSMMGSSVFTGKSELDDMLAVEDRNGVNVKFALENMGVPSTADSLPEFACYAEIHIEQGKEMDAQGKTIGLVESTWAASKYELTVHGFQSHTGSTLLKDRQDALLGAAYIITKIREIGEKYSTDEHPVVTSCGELEVVPNSPVVVAQKATLLVDLRCGDESVLDKADSEFKSALQEVEKLANVRIETSASHQWGAQKYSAQGVELSESIVQELGFEYTRTRTLAGHDSTNVKDVLPTVMLFVPSVDGVTHNEAEYTKDKDMISGLKMLTAVLAHLAAGELNA